MSSLLQIESLVYSFSFGILFYLFARVNYFILKNKTKFIKFIITNIFVIDVVLVYIYFMYKINNGIFHIYFILLLALGFWLCSKYYNILVKLCQMILKKAKIKLNGQNVYAIIPIGEDGIMKKTRKEKKRLILITLVIIGLIGSLFSSVSRDWVEILQNNKKADELAAKYDDLLKEEDKLKSEVTKLQDSDYVARYAKEKYLYSTEGETIIRLD